MEYARCSLRLARVHEHEPSVPRTPGRDFVDRGKNGLECICLLLAYKIKYPENFFLLRGNHECASINRIYGFYDECKRRYSIKLWKTFTDCFNCLPVAAVVDEKILCMHGGLSPDLQQLSQIQRIMRPTDVPDQGLLCDLLWSDPDKDVQGWGENDRGAPRPAPPECAALRVRVLRGARRSDARAHASRLPPPASRLLLAPRASSLRQTRRHKPKPHFVLALSRTFVHQACRTRLAPTLSPSSSTSTISTSSAAPTRWWRTATSFLPSGSLSPYFRRPTIAASSTTQVP